MNEISTSRKTKIIKGLLTIKFLFALAVLLPIFLVGCSCNPSMGEQTRIYVETLDAARIEKNFDGNNLYNGGLIRGVHYELRIEGGELACDNLSLEFSSIIFNSNNVVDAKEAIASFSGLNGGGAYRFTVDSGSFILAANIIPRKIEVTPSVMTRTFGDNDNLDYSFYYQPLGITIPLTFTREQGENVGYFNLTSVTSQSSNFIATLYNGYNKFRITPRVLTATANIGFTFEKEFDGNATFNISNIISGYHYTLSNYTTNTAPSLTILSAEFDNATVLGATRLFVSYSAEIQGANGNYIIVAGILEFNAKITPRHIVIEPNLFSLRFGESHDFITGDDLHILQQVHRCEISNINVPITFITEFGDNHLEAVAGSYDIVNLFWNNPNFALTLINYRNRFVVHRNNVFIFVQSRNAVFNGNPQTILPPLTFPERPLLIEFRLNEEGSEFTTELPIDAGMYIVRVSFLGDTNFYEDYTVTTLFIDRAATTITITSPLNHIYSGLPVVIAASTNNPDAVVEFSSNGFINAGTHVTLASVSQTRNHRAASIPVTVVIAPRVMTSADLIFPTAQQITFGQSLSESELMGGSTEWGTFSWMNGSVLPTTLDSQFAVNFTPFNTNNLNWSGVQLTRLVDITVNRFVVTNIGMPTAILLERGQALFAAILNQPSPHGTFVWANPNAMPTANGNQAVVFVPHDPINFDFGSINFNFNVFVTLSFRISFNTNGGDAIPNLVTTSFSQSSLPIPIRTGFVFEGWYLNANFTSRVATANTALTQHRTVYARWRQLGLTFTRQGNTYVVSQRAGETVERLYIPTHHNGLPVVAIANDGFRNNTGIRYVFIPNTVTLIGARAFENASNLLEIEIDNFQVNINFGANWNRTTNPRTDIHFTRW